MSSPCVIQLLRRRQARIEPDLDLPVAAAWTHLVWTEQDMPRAGADLSLAVRRRGPRLVDGDLHLLAAAPPAEAWAGFSDAALVKEADVERVAPGDQGVGIDLIVVCVADVQLLQPGRDVEGHVLVPPLVILRERPREDAVGSGGRSGRRSPLASVPQFSAAPLDASKSRIPSGRARRKTRVPGSGRTSGPVLTFSRTSPSVTLTITSLPRGSDTSTSAGCAPGAGVSSSWIASGRSPTLTPSLAATPCGASTRQSPASTSAPPSRRASTMFMGGLPMNCATNRFAGRWYTVSGEPSCWSLPASSTAMRSPMVMASAWSWVTKIVVTPSCF